MKFPRARETPDRGRDAGDAEHVLEETGVDQPVDRSSASSCKSPVLALTTPHFDSCKNMQRQPDAV
jgi:hypothetical protein